LNILWEIGTNFMVSLQNSPNKIKFEKTCYCWYNFINIFLNEYLRNACFLRNDKMSHRKKAGTFKFPEKYALHRDVFADELCLIRNCIWINLNAKCYCRFVLYSRNRDSEWIQKRTDRFWKMLWNCIIWLWEQSFQSIKHFAGWNLIDLTDSDFWWAVLKFVPYLFIVAHR
jgi:hypothetical protein